MFSDDRNRHRISETNDKVGRLGKKGRMHLEISTSELESKKTGRLKNGLKETNCSFSAGADL